MNKKGLNPNWKEKGIKTDPDIEYIEREVTEAIKDLNKVILTINDVIDNKAD